MVQFKYRNEIIFPAGIMDHFFYDLRNYRIYIENFHNLYFHTHVVTEKKFWYESDTGISFLDFLEKVRKETEN